MSEVDPKWRAGWEHGSEDQYADEHGKDPEPMNHDQSICHRCAIGKDTEKWYTGEDLTELAVDIERGD